MKKITSTLILTLLMLVIPALTSFTVPEKKIIKIIPLGIVEKGVLETIVSGVEEFYGCKCSISTSELLTTDLLAKSRTRYDAEKILNKYSKRGTVLLITEKDISYMKKGTTEWGILGMGELPGSACVISTFRLKRNVSTDLFLQRVKKICIHEIGHNIGLYHCTNDPYCLMTAANGTIKQIDKEKMSFCKSCSDKVKQLQK